MDIKETYEQYIMGTYSRQGAVIVSGNGCKCEDVDGKEYIDFTSGIGVNSLGYCDSEWAEAVSIQAKTLQHTSNIYYTKPQAELAEKLCKATGYTNVFFANSGAEANEGAIKIARKYSFDKYGEGRHTIITLKNSFHGRTITTLSATGQDVFHNFFHPFTQGFKYCTPNNIEELKATIDGTICGIMIEPVLGEGGVISLDKAYLKGLEKLCYDNDILLIADEVQTGVGRTGTMLATKQLSIKPNITTLAKGLGGGLPIGAVLADEKTSKVFSYSQHGTTFGGNPVVCAGAVTVLDRIDDEFLLNVVRKGELIRSMLKSCDEVENVSGLGLMLGITLKSKKAIEVQAGCLAAGLMVLTAKDKVRLLPPLNIDDNILKEGINILIDILSVN